MCQHHGTRSSTLTVSVPRLLKLALLSFTRFNLPSVVKAAATQQHTVRAYSKCQSKRSAETELAAVRISRSLYKFLPSALVYSCHQPVVAAVSFDKLAGSSDGECITAWRSTFSYMPPHCSTRLLQVVQKFTKGSASTSAQLQS